MIIKKTYRNKKWIFFGIIAIVVLVLLYVIKKRNFLEQEFPKLVETKTQQLYKISYDSLKVDELNGNVSVKNVVVAANNHVQQQLIKKNDSSASSTLINIHIPSIKIIGFKTTKALLSKKIVCNKIIIDQPKAVIDIYDIKSKKDINTQSKEFYKQLLGNFEQIQAGSVEINNANIIGQDFSSKKKLFQASKTFINLNEVKIDSAANEDTSRTFFCKDVSVKSESLVAGDRDKALLVSHIVYNTIDDKLHVRELLYDAFKGGGNLMAKAENIVAKAMKLHGPPDALLFSADAIEIDRTAFVTKKDAAQKDQQGANKKSVLPPWLKRFSINSFAIRNIAFNQLSGKPNEEDVSINNTALNITKVKLDSNSNSLAPLSNMFGEVRLYNPEISIVSDNKMYKYAFGNIVCNTKERSIKINSFSIKPLLNEIAFARKSKVRTNRYDVSFKDIVCNGVDFDKLIKGEVNIKTISTANSYFKDYIDISLPHDNKSRLGNYPAQLLFKLKVPVNVAKFSMLNSSIEYKEKNDVADSTGIVRFFNSDLIISNITNRPTSSSKICEINFNSKLLNKVPIKATVKFDLLQQEKGVFNIVGSVDKVDATVFNEFAIPMALNKFERGTVNFAKFSFNGDNYGMRGTVQLSYDDLKIVLLKKKENDKLKRKNLKTLLTNLLVKSSNKKNTGNQTTKVSYERDLTRSFFYTTWKAIHKGIMDILVIVK